MQVARAGAPSRVCSSVLRQVLDAAERAAPCRTGRAALDARSAATGRCRSPAPRRLGLVDDDGRALRARPCSAWPGSTMPCSITRVGVAPAVPEERVEVGDVDEQEVVAVGRRVTHLGDPTLRRVVLDVDRRNVAPAAAAEPARHSSELVAAAAGRRRRLGLGGLRSAGRSTPCRGQSHVRARPRPSGPRSGTTGTRYVCSPCTNAGRPRAVHVPEQDLHHGHRHRDRVETVDGADDRLRGRHAREARLARHRADARTASGARGLSPNSTRAAPPTAASARRDRRREQETTGVPTAAARWAGPVLPTTTAAAPRGRRRAPRAIVTPPRSTAREP